MNKILLITLVVVLSGCGNNDSLNGTQLLCKETYDRSVDYIPPWKRAGTCHNTVSRIKLFALDFGYNTVDLYHGGDTENHNYEATVDRIEICLTKNRDMDRCSLFRIDILRQDGRGFYVYGNCPIQCEVNSNATKVVSDAYDVFLQKEERREKSRLVREKQDKINREKINEEIRKNRKF